MCIINLSMCDTPASRPTIELEAIDTTTPEETVASACALLLEYGGFVVAQRGTAQFCFESLEKEAQRLPTSFTELGGGCMIARVNGEPAGFIAWRAVIKNVADASWEIKRLWVRQEARGLGLGRKLTEAILERARAAGQSAVYLDTVPESMGAAYSMYLDLGFEPCAAYNDNLMDGIAYMRKRLK